MSLPAEVERLIADASRLSVEDLDRVAEEGTRIRLAFPELAPPKLSAAAFSMLNKRVRDALQGRAEELRGHRLGTLRRTISATMMAATAIWRPDMLTPVEYHGLVDPFARVGLPVPPYPGEVPTTV